MKKFGFVAAVVLAGLIGGCQDDKPADIHTRQDAALRDPMNYGSNAGDRTNISGGGMMDFRKDAFKKDVNAVFNP